MFGRNRPARSVDGGYEALDGYVTQHYGEVKGWCHPDSIALCRLLNDIQLEAEVMGNIGEIGVYLGKFFIGLHNLKRAGERTLALDIFDRQDLNVDASGKGANMQVFEENIQKFAREPEACMAQACDSLTLSTTEAPPWAESIGRFRWFSIDGGHTAEHTINDFRLVEQWLAPRGIAVLDDYYNPHWHGVIEGVAHLFLHNRPRLVPFAYIANKHYFTPLSDHGFYVAALREKLAPFEEIVSSKMITMYGHPVLSLKSKPGLYEAIRSQEEG